jgi:spermidine synthase
MLLRPRDCIERVLILGLGGGNVARLVRRLHSRTEIVGVELDDRVLDLARRWFDIDQLDVEVVRQCAGRFLRADERYYDLIVEDVFLGSGGRAWKPDWLPEPGFELARRRLRPGGLIVSNTIEETRPVLGCLRRLFEVVISIRLDDYENTVLAAGGAGISARGLRAAMAAHAATRPLLDRLSARTHTGLPAPL